MQGGYLWNPIGEAATEPNSQWQRCSEAMFKARSVWKNRWRTEWTEIRVGNVSCGDQAELKTLGHLRVPYLSAFWLSYSGARWQVNEDTTVTVLGVFPMESRWHRSRVGLWPGAFHKFPDIIFLKMLLIWPCAHMVQICCDKSTRCYHFTFRNQLSISLYLMGDNA